MSMGNTPPYKIRQNRSGLDAGGFDRDSNNVSSQAVPCPSLDSSTSSFFSLANSTGFRSPLNADSGQRSGFSSSNNNATAGGVDDRPAARLLNYGIESTDSRATQVLPQEVVVPIAYPKANRPRLSQTPPLAAGPNFVTLNTRGATRQHLAFSNSPPPREAVSKLSLSSPLGVQKAMAKSADGVFYVSSALAESGYPRDGLFTSFGRAPSTQLTAKLESKEGPAQKRKAEPANGLPTEKSSDKNEGKLRADEASMPMSKSPKPPAVAGSVNNNNSNSNSKIVHTQVASASTAAAAAATPEMMFVPVKTSFASHTDPQESHWHSTDQLVQTSGNSVLAVAPSERRSAAGLTSSAESDRVRLSKSAPHAPPAVSAAATHAHRYSEADEETTRTAVKAPAGSIAATQQASPSSSTPPPPSHHHSNGVPKYNADKPTPSTSTSQTVMDCTTRSGRPHNSLRLSAEQMSKLSSNPMLRRPSVSAAPAVPPGWRPAPREPRSTNVADPTTAPETAVALKNVDAPRAAVQAPLRPTFTPIEDRSKTLISHAHHQHKPTGPQQPSVRFIYTRSGSTSKAASPDRPMLTTPGEKEITPPPAVAGTGFSTKTTTKGRDPASFAASARSTSDTAQTKVEAREAKPADAQPASLLRRTLATLRRSADPAPLREHHTRHSVSSVPFFRSATFAEIAEKEKDTSTRPTSETRGSVPRQRSVAHREAASSNSGRESQSPASDFDTAPQSYLMQWRLRQEEKQRAKEAGSTEKEEKKKASSRSGSSDAAVASGVTKVKVQTTGTSLAHATPLPQEASAVVNEKSSARKRTATPTQTPPPPSTKSAPPAAPQPSVVAPAEHVPIKEDEVRPQLSAPATNASWKRTKDDEAAIAAAPAAAPSPAPPGEQSPVTSTTAAATVHASAEKATPKKSANTSSNTGDVSPASRSAYSLSEALRSTSLPDANAGTGEATVTERCASDGAPMTTAAVAVPQAAPASVANSATTKSTPPPPLEKEKLTETMPGVTTVVPTATSTTAAGAAAAGAVGPGATTTPSFASHHHHYHHRHHTGSDSTFFTVASILSNSESVSPQQSSGKAHKNSQSMSGSYQTEDYVRRASVEEDIPEDQVLAAVSPIAPVEKGRRPSAVVAKGKTSPRRPAKRQEEEKNASEAKQEQVVSAATDQGKGAKASSPATAPPVMDLTPNVETVATRHNTAQPTRAQESAEAPAEDKQKEDATNTGDVRDVMRSVLERREQRLQQQQQHLQQESARRNNSERETPQLPVPPPPPFPTTPPPPASPSTSTNTPPPQQLRQSQQSLPNASLTGAPAADAVEVSCNSSKLGTPSGRRTISVTPYTPPWKVNLGNGSTSTSGGNNNVNDGATALLNSRPSSAPPEPVEKTAPTVPATSLTSGPIVAPAATTTTTPTPATAEDKPQKESDTTTTTTAIATAPVSRTQTPAVEPAHVRLDSLLATGTTVTLQKSARPSSGTVTPSSVAGPTGTVRDGRTFAMGAGPHTDVDDDDDETSQQPSSRISQLLARRSSFTRRLSHGGEGNDPVASTAAFAGNASFTQATSVDTRREPPFLSSADHSSLPNDSVMASARTKDKDRSPALSSFNMAAAMESIPTAADIEREARLAEQRAASDVREATAGTAVDVKSRQSSAPPEAQVAPQSPQEQQQQTTKQSQPESATVSTRSGNAADKLRAPSEMHVEKPSDNAISTNAGNAREITTKPATPVVSNAPRPLTSFAARPLTSPVEAETTAPLYPPNDSSTTQTATTSSVTAPASTAATTTITTTTTSTNVRRKSSAGKIAAPATALGEIKADELDKLEESVNALLKSYGKTAVSAAATTGTLSAATTSAETTAVGSLAHHSTAAGVKSDTPSKMTAADLLLAQMPQHVQTTAEKKKAAAAAAAAARLSHSNSVKSTKHGWAELSGSSSSRHRANASEWDDEDSHWDASVLWCGEESDTVEASPPLCVPPLDLTSLQLPTGEYDDLKPYRIPLPTAVAVPEENRRQLLKLAGIVSCSSASPEAEGNEGSARSSSTVTVGGRNSGAFTGAGGSFTSSTAFNKSSTSLTDVTPLVGERIRRMKEQPVEPPAARKLRVSRRVSLASGSASTSMTTATTAVSALGGAAGLVAVGDAVEHRHGSPGQLSDTSEDTEGRENSIQELVDEAPQRISRVVRFTDDSDALDGGRGVARDMRVGQQKNRVRLVLLDCEEQRERKVLLAEEQNAFVVIGKSYRRSSLLT